MELIINGRFGKVITDAGVEICVLKVNDLYNLSIQKKGGFSFWAKENCKRLSTIQKYLNERDYDVVIKEV